MAKAGINLVLNDHYRPWLAQMGLDTFERLMSSETGCVLEKTEHSEIRRIEGGGKTAYLKRRLTSPIMTSIESYLSGRRAHTAPFTEYLHVCSLRQAQLPVMNWMAVGEERKWGFPRAGFILVDEVKGVPLDRALNLAEMQDRDLRLLQSYGALLGRLHQQGFYGSLRLKDLIVTDLDQGFLVMIDREARHPYPRGRSAIKTRQALDRSFRRIRRDLPGFNDHHIGIVMQSYRQSFECEPANPANPGRNL
jgi:hypothetical protein